MRTTGAALFLLSFVLLFVALSTDTSSSSLLGTSDIDSLRAMHQQTLWMFGFVATFVAGTITMAMGDLAAEFRTLHRSTAHSDHASNWYQRVPASLLVVGLTVLLVVALAALGGATTEFVPLSTSTSSPK
jgi:hypothetical protein